MFLYKNLAPTLASLWKHSPFHVMVCLYNLPPLLWEVLLPGMDVGWILDWTGMDWNGMDWNEIIKFFSGPLKRQTQHIIIMIGLS